MAIDPAEQPKYEEQVAVVDSEALMAPLYATIDVRVVAIRGLLRLTSSRP
jgi:hypothetical protein